MERIRMRNGFDYISQYVLSICSLLMSEAKAHNVEEEGISPLWFGTRFGTYATTHNCPGLCTSCTCIIPFYMVTPKSLFICKKSQEALSIPLLPTMCASLKFTFDFLVPQAQDLSYVTRLLLLLSLYSEYRLFSSSKARQTQEQAAKWMKEKKRWVNKTREFVF